MGFVLRVSIAEPRMNEGSHGKEPTAQETNGGVLEKSSGFDVRTGTGPAKEREATGAARNRIPPDASVVVPPPHSRECLFSFQRRYANP